jgi:DDE family transposase
VFIDIDSLLRPVYGHAKQGASYGHTKIAGKQTLRKGLSPLATTISTVASAPVIAGMRLRAGKAGSARGAGRMVAQAIGTVRAVGASGQILVRGDSAYGSRTVVRACARGGAQFSLVMTRNPAIERAIAAIDEHAWTPVQYPGAVRDPDTGAWISDRGRRNRLHRFRVHPRPHHRPPCYAARQGRMSPRRAVPGLAVSPVLHQHRPPSRRGRHHPP